MSFEHISSFESYIVGLWNIMKSCEQDIFKTIIWAWALKLDVFIGDEEQITWLTFEKKGLILLELCPFPTLVFCMGKLYCWEHSVVQTHF